VKLSARDYTLVVIGQRMAPLLRQFGELETDIARRRLRAVTIERPLFICGLARSGTTILINLLSQAKGVATHRYRDFPFLWTPIIWNWFQDRLVTAQPPSDRPHIDRIKITPDSPEAFEEPIWQFFFPWVHDRDSCHVLDADTRCPTFEMFFRDHICKILLIRGGDRYVSKGNYNVARIEYLARLFPDARFIVPVRAPLAHVHSLVKQHRLFTGYAKQDGRIANYLRAAGHYEFGPQRQPINMSRVGGQRIHAAWQANDDYRGYAALWSEVYAQIERLTLADSELVERIFVLRYEDLCTNPKDTLNHILDFAALGDRGDHVLDGAETICAPPDETMGLPETTRNSVGKETEGLAARLGYQD